MTNEERLAKLRTELLVNPAVLAVGPVKPVNEDGSFGPMPMTTAEHLTAIKPVYAQMILDALAAENARITAWNDAMTASGSPFVRKQFIRYGGFTDKAISDSFNTLVDGYEDASVEDIREPLFTSGDWGIIELLAAQVPALTDVQLVQVNVLCRNVVATLTRARTIPSKNFGALKAAADALLAVPFGNRTVLQASTHADVLAAMNGKVTVAYQKALVDGFRGIVSPEEISVALRG